MTTNLTYTGKLIVDIDSKQYTEYNHGTNYLFKLLTHILCKQNFSSSSLPAYFMLYSGDLQSNEAMPSPYVQDVTNKKLFSRFVDIQLNDTTNTDNSVSFSAAIDSSILSDRITSVSNTPLTLALVSRDRKGILATVSFDTNVYNTIREGGRAIVTWIMTFSNSTN